MLFPADVVNMVVGVTNFSHMLQLKREHQTRELQPEESAQVNNALITGADARVVMIKIADRLHNLRTLGALPAEKRLTCAHETMEIFTPLAERLGLGSFKAELEDLCFKHLEPEEYAELRAVLGSEAERTAILEAVEAAEAALRETGSPAVDVCGRPKNLYGIHKKMQKKGVELGEVWDTRAIRIIVETPAECYAALEKVHGLWEPVEGRYKDYIKSPKANDYQSLHTVVRDASGCAFEVQVRTVEMHQRAEFGAAAHWRYKESAVEDDCHLEEKVAFARFMLSFTGVSDVGKLRARGEDGEQAKAAPPCCSFPHHHETCVHFGYTGHEGPLRDGTCVQCAPSVAGGAADENSVTVLTVGDGDFRPRKLPAHAHTLADLLRSSHATASSTALLNRGLSVRVNGELVAFDPYERGVALSTPLRNGDLVEFFTDLSPAAVNAARSRFNSMLLDWDDTGRVIADDREIFSPGADGVPAAASF